jgi:hypothetical protein
MYMQVRAPEENTMTIGRGRLQQIIKEEVARLLREAEEGEQSAAEVALGALQSGAYRGFVTAGINRIEAQSKREQAAFLRDQAAAKATEMSLEEEDPSGQADQLEDLAGKVELAAQKSDEESARAAASLEQVAGILGSVGAATAEEPEEAPPDEEEAAPETVTEGALLERWNTLAFGRRRL